MQDQILLEVFPVRPRGIREAIASAIRNDTTIAIVATSHLATDILIGAFGAMLPHLQTRFGLSGSQVAVLAAVLAATSSLGQPLAGRLAEQGIGRGCSGDPRG